MERLPLESKDTTFDASNLKSGFYYIKLMDGNNILSTLQFIIE